MGGYRKGETMNDNIERRQFLKLMAAAGLCPLLAPVAKAADVLTPVSGQVPRRKLGKTGVMIPCLAVGAPQTAEVMDRALHYGFTHWDTAASYSGCEPAIGRYFAQNKGARANVFLSAKPADITTPFPVVADVQKSLEQSLKEMKTDYIDMYFGVHAMRKPEQLTDELRQFAETAKKKGQIRFFGFSNHANMAENLPAAAKLDWIDACFVAYNYRYKAKPNPKLEAAIDACHQAGIGLIAIKTQGFGSKSLSAEEKVLTDHFTTKGYEEAQAKIKLVLEDKRFTSASVGMKTVEIVDSCAGAALDKSKLTQQDRQVLEQFAQTTCDSYCAGCANVCGAALPVGLPMISDIMRYRMYHENYGEPERARALFAQIPGDVRQQLLTTDFRQAEALCPQRIPIGELVTDACQKLA